MHAPATPSGVSHDHKTLLQVEAYLNYSLDVNAKLIESTHAKLTSLESQLATPAAAGGKLKKSLKATRARTVKKLRQCQTEAETLTKASDEVKAQLAGMEMAMGRRLSVISQPGLGGSYASSPLDGMSERSSSISSYISSGELSSGQQFAYAQAAPYMVSPLAASMSHLPFIQTNLPMGLSMHNLPSAPLHPMTPYLASPYAYPYSATHSAIPEPWTTIGTFAPHVPWQAYHQQYPEPAHQQPQMSSEVTIEGPPLVMPVATTTWDFQQSPTSDTQTAMPSPKTKTMRRFSIAATPPALSDTAAVTVKRGHRRGVSCNIEELVRNWDAGSWWSPRKISSQCMMAFVVM